MDNNMSDMINKLLSDPDSMKKLMEMANSLGLGPSSPVANQHAAGQSDGTAVPAMAGQSAPLGNGGTEALSRAVQALGGLTSAPAANNKHSALLMALKPYMRSQRQQKLDGAMKLLSAVKVFRSMGGGL